MPLKNQFQICLSVGLIILNISKKIRTFKIKKIEHS